MAVTCISPPGPGGAWTPTFSCPNFGLSCPSGSPGLVPANLQQKLSVCPGGSQTLTALYPAAAQVDMEREEATYLVDEAHLSAPGHGLKYYRLLQPFLQVLTLRHCLPALPGWWELLPHQPLKCPAMSNHFRHQPTLRWW